MTCEAVLCPDRSSVRFAIYPSDFDGPRVLAEISNEALRQLFGANREPATLLSACKLHFDIIEAMALECYRRHPFSAVCLRAADFACAFSPRSRELEPAARLAHGGPPAS